MSCKSAIYAVNTSTATIPEGGTYQPNTIIRRFGQCCQMANNAMELNGQGYYDVAVTATVVGTAVGNVTMAVYQDGAPVPGMNASQTVYNRQCFNVNSSPINVSLHGIYKETFDFNEREKRNICNICTNASDEHAIAIHNEEILATMR